MALAILDIRALNVHSRNRTSHLAPEYERYSGLSSVSWPIRRHIALSRSPIGAPSVDQWLNSQAMDNSYRTNGLLLESLNPPKGHVHDT
jgi:hypothetical protein